MSNLLCYVGEYASVYESILRNTIHHPPQILKLFIIEKENSHYYLFIRYEPHGKITHHIYLKYHSKFSVFKIPEPYNEFTWEFPEVDLINIEVSLFNDDWAVWLITQIAIGISIGSFELNIKNNTESKITKTQWETIINKGINMLYDNLINNNLYNTKEH